MLCSFVPKNAEPDVILLRERSFEGVFAVVHRQSFVADLAVCREQWVFPNHCRWKWAILEKR